MLKLGVAPEYFSCIGGLLHLAYTAREGGSTLRSAVESELVKNLNALALDDRTGLYSGHSLRRDFPN